MNIKTLTFLFIAPFLLTQSAHAQIIEALPPSQVENLVVTHNGSSLNLSWDAATDEDGVVVGYKIYYGQNSVTEAGQSYEDETVVENQTQYVLDTNINPSNTYYVALTAIDDESNESENFSVEAVAAPTGGGPTTTAPTQTADTKSPTVIRAEYPTPGTIVVTMSEPILIEQPDNAFTVVHKESGKYIDVSSVVANGEKATISVAPEDISLEQTYSVTASYWVTDLAGNPVSSGIIDTVELKTTQIYGGNCDTIDCFIEGVENNAESDIGANFSVNYFDLVQVDYEGVFSFYTPEGSSDPAIQIKIDNATSSLDDSVDVGLGPINLCMYNDISKLNTFLRAVETGSVDVTQLFNAFTECDVYNENAIFEETTKMGSEGLEFVRNLVDLVVEVNTNVTDTNFNDPFGNPPTIDPNDSLFPTNDVTDTIAPLDATKLEADTAMVAETKTVPLQWVPAADTDGDIVDQLLFVRTTQENFPEQGISLGKSTQAYEVPVKVSQSYEIKIVTVDASGNQSYGLMVTFSTGLNKSGGDMGLVWLVIGAMATIFFLKRRNA